MELNITGLDELQRQLEELQRAMESLDGPIANLKFDPKDPASVQRAIREMETEVDRKVAPYSGNPFVAQVVEQSKEHFRAGILERARKQQ
jgi:prefoldin subunit 5